MSYRIEITAASLSELGGKLLALASQFNTTPVDPVMPEVREAAPPKPAKVKAAKPQEVAEAAPAPEPTTSETSAPSPDTSSASNLPQTEKPSPALDFDADITPLVLRVVSEKSREVVIDILGQFGASRASEVPEAQWQELYNALQDAL